jgi:integration host factor subunit alpha
MEGVDLGLVGCFKGTYAVIIFGGRPMTLTKDDIVEAVAEETGFPKTQSVELVETLLELIKKALESGADVLVSGFGKFKVREKKARQGRNPYTGEGVIIEPRRVVTFKWSRKLRQKINR